MEKAILKTVIYADIFDYPLRTREIHRWLIGPPAGRSGKKTNLRQVEKALAKLVSSLQAVSHRGYYFLPGRSGIVPGRWRREKQSKIYFRKAKVIGQILKIIPWIKLIGISGGLAMENASKRDDIDLFVITATKRLWISRLLLLLFLQIMGQRRKRSDGGRKTAGKFCINLLLEENCLEQRSRDIFVAHEVLQMKVLWQRDGIYAKYLEENNWAFKFLPNWVGDHRSLRLCVRNLSPLSPLADLLENLAKKFQLWYMKSPQGMERIENGALYFHPRDIRNLVLSAYKEKIKKLL